MFNKKVKEYKNRFTLLYEDRVNEVVTPEEFLLLKAQYNDEIANCTNRINEIDKEMDFLSNKKEQQKKDEEIFKEYKHLKKLDRLAVETFISKIIMGKKDPITKKRPMHIDWNICSL